MRSANLAAGLLACVLTACGGGGGGDGESPPPPAPPAESLIPPAASLGATLAVDATALRPVRAGSAWSFRGFRYAGAGGPRQYTSSVRHVADGRGDVVERASDIYTQDQSTSQQPSLRGGTVMLRITDPFGFDPRDVVSTVELRSPVRVNDQFGQLERTAVPTGIDHDNDGIVDRADLALYRTVIGRDTVELAEVPHTVSAVRVDTTYVVRVTRSSDGRKLPVVRVVDSSWYAEGLGVVRRALSAPSSGAGAGAVVAEETLISYDGIDRGLGATTPEGVQAGAPISAAVRAGDNVVVITGEEDPAAPGNLHLALLDQRGQVQRQFVAASMRSPELSAQPSLVSLGAQGAMLVAPFLVAPGRGQVRLQRIDATGHAAGAREVLALPGVTRYSAAWDGSALWFLFGQEAGGGGTDLMLQPFGLDGQPLAAAERLDAAGGGTLVASQGRLLATWVRTEPTRRSHVYGFKPSMGAPTTIRVLGTVECCNPMVNALVPVLGPRVAAIHWRGPLLSYGGAEPAPEMRPRGVMLDATGEAVRTPARAIDRELLPRQWLDADAGLESPFVATAIGDRIAFAGFKSNRRIPQTALASDFLLLSVVEPGAASLASAASTAPSFAADNGSSFEPFRAVRLLVPFETHVLALGDGTGPVSSRSVFWLPGGAGASPGR